MITFLVDSNIFLRYILKDNVTQWKLAQDYFIKARRGEVKLIFLSDVILEIEFVLRKYYRKSNQEISQYLSSLLAAPYIEIEKREILYSAFAVYQHTNIEIVDLILYFTAKSQEARILTFDKRLTKLNV